MTIDLLGANLEPVILADQLISRLEYICGKSLIHCDIKPENFVMGTGEGQNQVNIDL
jgi:serine/threonine protein kinase